MPSVIEQCTQALQEGHFASARDLARDALAGTAAPAARLPLFELLAQAQVGLQDHVAAARQVIVLQMLDRRLGTLAAGTSSKALQRQMATLRTAMPSALLERLQTFAAFADA